MTGEDGGFCLARALADAAATHRLARRVAGAARAGDLIALHGPLGAGKTTFARGFLRARGVAEHVPSPTFTLAQLYEPASGPVWHCDLYRIDHADELRELGLEEALDEAILLVEWAERWRPPPPVPRLDVRLAFAPSGRLARLRAGACWAGRLRALADAC